MALRSTIVRILALLAIVLSTLAAPLGRASAAEVSLDGGRYQRAGAGWRTCETADGVETCRSVVIDITEARGRESTGAGSMEQTGRDIVCVTHQVLRRPADGGEGMVDELDELGCEVLPLGSVKFEGIAGASLPATRVTLSEGCHWTPDTGCRPAPGRAVTVTAEWRPEEQALPSRPMHWVYSDGGCVFGDSWVGQFRWATATGTIEGEHLPAESLWGAALQEGTFNRMLNCH
ncbi:MAG: hypothetical protein M3Q29_01270 [Chloroflexota bacterium]|nr:hypothetical protein [Chloroflexota bacterium]